MELREANEAISNLLEQVRVLVQQAKVIADDHDIDFTISLSEDHSALTYENEMWTSSSDNC